MDTVNMANTINTVDPASEASHSAGAANQPSAVPEQQPALASAPKMPSGLKFHKDYSVSKGVILEANDDVCFGFDMDVLVKHSEFFKDLCDLPCESPAEDGHDPILPLPVGSEAIKIALDNATAIEHGLALPTLPELSHFLLDDIVIIWDMLDCASCSRTSPIPVYASRSLLLRAMTPRCMTSLIICCLCVAISRTPQRGGLQGLNVIAPRSTRNSRICTRTGEKPSIALKPSCPPRRRQRALASSVARASTSRMQNTCGTRVPFGRSVGS